MRYYTYIYFILVILLLCVTRINENATHKKGKSTDKVIVVTRIAIFEYIFYIYLIFAIIRTFNKLDLNNYLNIALCILIALVSVILIFSRCRSSIFLSFQTNYFYNNYDTVFYDTITRIDKKKLFFIWKVDILHEGLVETFYVSSKSADKITYILNTTIQPK